MNKSVRIGLLVVGALAVGALLFYVGLATGTNQRFGAWTGMMSGPGMMGTLNGNIEDAYPYGMGMMGSENGRFRGAFGMNMMGMGTMNMMGPNGMPGMMGAYNPNQVDSLSLQEAETAVQNFLVGLDIEGLAIDEIMIFDNHAYAQIVETGSGVGAMEVLVDPVSQAVYPEHGPNMMWNLKYNWMYDGMMGGNGMMGGAYGSDMMDGFGGQRGYGGSYAQPLISTDVSADMALTPEEAIEIANEYLAENQPGYQVAEEADAFYGYYTLHVLRDGDVAGMLSVNGLNERVFLHIWHGEFIEMSADH